MLKASWRRRFGLILVGLFGFGLSPMPALTGTVNAVFADSPGEPVVRLEDDASSLQAAGWSRSSPPEEGVYIVDSAHTLGNPHRIQTKPVPPGQYLFYGDRTASALSKYTTISKKMPIGSGAWSLSFSAKFVDLMKPSQHAIYRGISFEIFAAGKEYKLTFNDTNKLLAMKNAPGSYEQREIAMPADDAFHEWEISYDGDAAVAVKLDGSTVASFDHIAIPVSGREDELVILNAPLNWESGTNEVYMDSIRMYSRPQTYVPTDTLFDDDGSSLQTAGWTGRIAPIDGLYIVDSSHSLGNPNRIDTKPVPPGQYLFYGDERASAQGKYARIIKPLSIGPGAWAVEFSARFVDLIKPSQHFADRGIYFDIYAAEKRYKVAFNDTDKVMTDANNRKQVPMPTDDAFHRWEIGFNGQDTVYVKLDGSVVATFDRVAVPAAGITDRLQIANVPLDRVSGTNEVYLDSVKVYKTEAGDPNILIDDDASNLHTAKWSVDPPAAGAYFTDYARSNGVVDGMLPAEEGRYLTYAGSDAAKETKIKRQVPIGSGPWSLEFDARFAALAQPAAPGADQGFMIEVVAGGKKHKLVFNNGSQIYVSQANGSYRSIETGLLSATYYDQWGLAYDEHARLILTRNGIKLGFWPDTGMPVQEPDGITVINQAAGATGETRVYIDRVKLMKQLLPKWSEFQPQIVGVSVLPESDTAEISAIVSLFDTDPLWFDSGRLTIEAQVVRDGQVVQQAQQPVRGPTVPLQLAANGQTGWMELLLKLKDGSQVKSEIAHKVDVYASVSKLEAGQQIEAVPGRVHLFTDMDYSEDSAGRPPWQDGWRLARYTYDGTETGGLLLESASDAGPLRLPVRLNGWFGVYIGYVTGTEGVAVSGGDQSRQIVVDGVTNDEPYGGKGISEAFALASEFDSGTVEIAPVAGKQARIAYVKLKGLSAEEVALYTKRDEGEAGRRVIYNNDGYSDYFSGLYDTEQKLLDNAVDFFEGRDANSLYWTLGTTMLILRDSETAGRPYRNLTPEQEQNLMRDGDKRVRDVVLSYIDAGKDPLKIVAERVNEIGMDAYASLRMNAFYSPASYPWLNGPRYDEFAGKGYRQTKTDGSPDNRMSYAYPEFRQFVIDVLKEAAAVSDANGRRLLKGVELDYCRYPYVLGYEPVLTDAYMQQYGVHPRQETTPEGQQRWNAFKADVMTGFMRDVRQQLAGQQISVRIPYDLYVQNGLDIEAWIQEQLIDTLTVCTLGHETFFDGIDYFKTLTEGTNVKLYGNMNATLSGSDLTRQEEDLLKRGIRLNKGGQRTSKQQFMLRAHEFYQAGYDGVYIFNNWRAGTPDGSTLLGELGDKVKLEKWYAFGYPAEWVQNLATVEPVVPEDTTPPELTVTMTRYDGTPYVNDTWSNQSVTVSVYAADRQSAVTSVVYSVYGGAAWTAFENGIRFDREGTFTLQIKSTDGARNVALEQRTVKIAKQSPPDAADLSDLRINGKKVPRFDADAAELTVHVGNSVPSVTVTPAARYGGAVIRVKVNDGEFETVPSGAASLPAAVSAGSNRVYIQVTGEDGLAKKTYFIHLIKAARQAGQDHRGPDGAD
ncbi:cadherin-like beta sandwich domain-containing protein [Paenibacillus sp. GYB003]|uniref:cadherin-like beta sandwich domain-containing protein n=1 Tax=Paenibacillus sp. GYB003 TaxID=2994392 RepID=UPI002F96D128